MSAHGRFNIEVIQYEALAHTVELLLKEKGNPIGTRTSTDFSIKSYILLNTLNLWDFICF